MKKKKTKEFSYKLLISNTFFVLKFLFKTNKKLFFARVPVLVLQIVSPFIPIVFIKYILDTITVADNMPQAIFYVIAMALVTFLASTLSNIFSTLDQIQVSKTRHLANLALGKSTMRFQYADLEKPETKTFVALAQEDSMIYILTLVTNLFSSVAKVIGLSAIVFTVQPLILLLIASVIAVKTLINRKNRERVAFYRNTQAPLNRRFRYPFNTMQDLSFAKEIRVNNLTGWLNKRIQKQFDEEMLPLYKKSERDGHKLSIFITLSGLVQECIVYFILAYRVIFTGMSIGSFSMYMTSINSFSDSLNTMFFSFGRLILLSRFAREFRYCIELEKNVKDESLENFDTEHQWNNVKIAFKNVSFTYPDTDKVILKNISITLEPKKSLSIVGINGAGKTTFVKLLCRLYEPTEGEILMNGIPINRIPIDYYYDMLGVVFQDFKLFSFSVRENIELNTKSNEDKLRKSIEKSGLVEKINTLPQKFETMISKEFDDNGIEFSGGEGQKLAIARALYKDAPMIILDEPTSALDPIAEYEIYRRFNELTEGKSTIYISHRLSSTRFTDKIAVFSDGELVEYGNHKELIQIEDGVYKNMFEMQAQFYH